MVVRATVGSCRSVDVLSRSRPARSPGASSDGRLLADLVPIYPLYALLFADSGLSDAEISALFALWSAVGIIAEVPSGALADRFGRRTALVVGALVQAARLCVLGPVPRVSRLCGGLRAVGTGRRPRVRCAGGAVARRAGRSRCRAALRAGPGLGRRGGVGRAGADGRDRDGIVRRRWLSRGRMGERDDLPRYRCPGRSASGIRRPVAGDPVIAGRRDGRVVPGDPPGRCGGCRGAPAAPRRGAGVRPALRAGRVRGVLPAGGPRSTGVHRAGARGAARRAARRRSGRRSRRSGEPTRCRSARDRAGDRCRPARRSGGGPASGGSGRRRAVLRPVPRGPGGRRRPPAGTDHGAGSRDGDVGGQRRRRTAVVRGLCGVGARRNGSDDGAGRAGRGPAAGAAAAP